MVSRDNVFPFNLCLLRGLVPVIPNKMIALPRFTQISSIQFKTALKQLLWYTIHRIIIHVFPCFDQNRLQIRWVIEHKTQLLKSPIE